MVDEALRRADDLLSELIETVETARALPMSTSCVVPRERLLDLLDELREVLPPEMDEARRLVVDRDRVLTEAHEHAADSRARAVAEADAVLADASHRASETLGEAEQRAQHAVDAAQAEQERLVSATSVHQAAAAAAAALRDDAEKYHQQVSVDAQLYEAKTRGDADRHARQSRVDAERYVTKLTADAEDYAERTLDELAAVLHKAASTAEQGRAALASRRATEWASGQPSGYSGDQGEWTPIPA